MFELVGITNRDAMDIAESMAEQVNDDIARITEQLPTIEASVKLHGVIIEWNGH